LPLVGSRRVDGGIGRDVHTDDELVAQQVIIDSGDVLAVCSPAGCWPESRSLSAERC
jgi:hypothetical protein